MILNRAGTVTDDGGFLSIEQEGLFPTVCKRSRNQCKNSPHQAKSTTDSNVSTLIQEYVDQLITNITSLSRLVLVEIIIPYVM